MNGSDKYIISGRDFGKIFSGLCLTVLGTGAILMVVTMSSVKGFSFGLIFIIALALAFLYFGTRMVFYVDLIVLDRLRSKIITKKGYFTGRNEKEYSFDGVIKVTITKLVKTSDDSTYTIFPVRILGYPAIDVSKHRNYQVARKQAEEIAEILAVPLKDSSTGKSVERDYKYLSTPMYEVVRNDPVNVRIPEPPADFGIEVERLKDKVTITVPCRTWDFKNGLLMLIGSILLLICASQLIRILILVITPEIEPGSPIKLAIWLAILTGVPGYCSVGIASLKSFAKHIIKLDKSGLTLQKRSVLASETQNMPAYDLEELIVGYHETSVRIPDQALIARSDKKSLMICQGQPKVVLEWLRDAIPASIDSLYPHSFRPELMNFITREKN